MQVAFQRQVDAAVSKTVNLPADATVADVRRIFLQAWRGAAKGITVYRYGSKPGQVLTLLGEQSGGWTPPVRVDAGYAGGCAAHACEF
jgi:ribonucleoside-diphosphate reductase alpha chain